MPEACVTPPLPPKQSIWLVVKIMVPCWVLSIIQHQVFRGPKGDHNLDNHPHVTNHKTLTKRQPPVDGETQTGMFLVHGTPAFLSFPYIKRQRQAYIPYYTIPYHTIPYHTIPYHTIPYHTIPYHTIPYHTIPYHTIPYHTIPYYTILYYTILYYTILYYSILKSPALRPKPYLVHAVSVQVTPAVAVAPPPGRLSKASLLVACSPRPSD